MATTTTDQRPADHLKTILLVDDTAENLYAIGSLLQPHYRVRAANGGAAALEAIRQTPYPDLILLDIMMPEIDGYEVLRRLKAAPETAAIPVIFVTAMDSHGDEAYGLELGAVDYLTKPVVPALLLARIHTQLAMKDARDWLADRNTVLATEVARQTVELKAAKEAAESASHAKSFFINKMSHELLTPMNGVIGMLQLARGEIPADNAALDFLQVAADSASDMVAQLNAILDYAAIAHGEVALRRQPMDVADLLEHLAMDWRGPAEKKGLAFSIARKAGTPELIVGDESHLRHALSILLDNAVKFTHRGEITLGAEASEAGIRFWVSDTGIGVPDAKIDAIFQPFEQGDESNTRHYGGAGLGLAIARRLVELMGGTLCAESVPEVGSTFSITLQEIVCD